MYSLGWAESVTYLPKQAHIAHTADHTAPMDTSWWVRPV